MLKINVNNKEYKIRFGYKVLCDSDLIDDIMSAFSPKDGSGADPKKIMDAVAELLLAGLQKYHSDEFPYGSDGKEKVYELMDDYEDSSTDGNVQDCFGLFQKLQDELFENGFFKRLRKETESDEKKVPKKA